MRVKKRDEWVEVGVKPAVNGVSSAEGKGALEW